MKDKKLIVFDLVMNNYVDDYFDYNTLMTTCKDLYYIGFEGKKRKDFFDKNNPFDQLIKKFPSFQPNITYVLSLGYFCISFFKIPVEEYNPHTLEEFSLKIDEKTYKLVKNKLPLPTSSLLQNIKLSSIHNDIVPLPYVYQTDSINIRLFEELNNYNIYAKYKYIIRSTNKKIVMHDRSLLFSRNYSVSLDSKEELRLSLKKIVIDNIDKGWDFYTLLASEILQVSDITERMLEFF